MLADRNAMATVAVKDLARARGFYGNILGLELQEELEGGVLVYRTGSSSMLVYLSTFAGTNEATAVTFALGDAVDATVRALREKGVAFEHYDMPGTTLEGDVHVQGDDGMRVAWFKDPDGNIICLVNG